jgi:uncharacterized protein YceH (UPF0502 family)
MLPEDSVSYGPNGPWPVFTTNERRVLGVLIEKGKTSSDGYPMTMNALVTGCNQKSNRDPVLELEEDDVEEALTKLKGRALVAKVMSGRVDKWRHLLYESWHVDKREMAILAELLLRGPQTEGELRTRANRMEPIPDLDALRGYLKALVDRNLAVYLTAEDRRGAVVSHGFHAPEELPRLKHQFTSGPASVAAHVPAPVARAEDPRIPALEAAVARLTAEMEAVKAEVRALRQQLGG